MRLGDGRLSRFVRLFAALLLLENGWAVAQEIPNEPLLDSLIAGVRVHRDAEALPADLHPSIHSFFNATFRPMIKMQEAKDAARTGELRPDGTDEPVFQCVQNASTL